MIYFKLEEYLLKNQIWMLKIHKFNPPDNGSSSVVTAMVGMDDEQDEDDVLLPRIFC